MDCIAAALIIGAIYYANWCIRHPTVRLIRMGHLVRANRRQRR